LNSSPSVPGADRDVYLVEDDLGRIWAETDVEMTDFRSVIGDILSGQYKNPVRVVAFNVAEGWSQDASSEVAHEICRACDAQSRDVPIFLQERRAARRALQARPTFAADGALILRALGLVASRRILTR